MAGILWIASYPKSGNTWVRIFLANLILNEPEPVPFARIGSVCPGEAHEIWFRPFTDRPVSELSRAEIAKLRCHVQMCAARTMKHIIPLKTHNYLGEDYGHPLISMEATRAVVYILRDPRDVALSVADQFGVSVAETIEIMNKEGATGRATPGHSVHEVLSSWSIHVESWTQMQFGKLHVVRYEDLLADPYGELGKIARKLGITTEEARIRRAVGHASFKTLQEMERDKGFAERSEFSETFFRSGRSGAWKDELTPELAKRIERDHREQMKRFGYL
ncbi:MAG: sulfotransferase domain-containing protein [Proteobacteria bacterium]|nr:sulfotransferase domain-containing protein [Pseudomonadota bacterium]